MIVEEFLHLSFCTPAPTPPSLPLSPPSALRARPGALHARHPVLGVHGVGALHARHPVFWVHGGANIGSIALPPMVHALLYGAIAQ